MKVLHEPVNNSFCTCTKFFLSECRPVCTVEDWNGKTTKFRQILKQIIFQYSILTESRETTNLFKSNFTWVKRDPQSKLPKDIQRKKQLFFTYYIIQNFVSVFNSSMQKHG